MRTAALSLMTMVATLSIGGSTALAEISWESDLRSAHARAQSDGKLLLLHFYSDDCFWCKKLEQGAFREPIVGQAIAESFVPVKVHANSSKKLTEMFNVTKFPTDVIVTTRGTTLAHSISPQIADQYAAMLKTTAANWAAANPPTTVETLAENGSPETDRVGNAEQVAPIESPPVESSDSQANLSQTPSYAIKPEPTDSPRPTSVSLRVSSTPEVQVQPSQGFVLPGQKLNATLTGARNPSPGNRPQDANSLNKTDLAVPADAKLVGQVSDYVSDQSGVSDQPEASISDNDASQVAETQSSGGAVPADPPKTSDREPTGGTLVTDEQQEPGLTITSTGSRQPELAMQGHCPVTVIQDDKWVQGHLKFGVIHLGKLYLFANAENMQVFLNDPMPYTPVLNEIDPVVFFEEQRIVPGKREWGLKDPIYHRMFFFSDEASMNHFYNQYERYTKPSIDIMNQAMRDANPGI